jgi:hypothetical protein
MQSSSSSSSSSSSLVKGYYFSLPSLTYCIDNHTVVNLAILLLQEIFVARNCNKEEDEEEEEEELKWRMGKNAWF